MPSRRGVVALGRSSGWGVGPPASAALLRSGDPGDLPGYGAASARGWFRWTQCPARAQTVGRLVRHDGCGGAPSGCCWLSDRAVTEHGPLGRRAVSWFGSAQFMDRSMNLWTSQSTPWLTTAVLVSRYQDRTGFLEGCSRATGLVMADVQVYKGPCDAGFCPSSVHGLRS